MAVPAAEALQQLLSLVSPRSEACCSDAVSGAGRQLVDDPAHPSLSISNGDTMSAQASLDHCRVRDQGDCPASSMQSGYLSIDGLCSAVLAHQITTVHYVGELTQFPPNKEYISGQPLAGTSCGPDDVGCQRDGIARQGSLR